jgi:hypothetical protein
MPGKAQNKSQQTYNDSERTIAEDWFWDVVRVANWPLHQHGTIEDGKVIMAAHLNPEEAERFAGMLREKKKILRALTKAHVDETGDSLGLGDDSMDDLAHHVIGMGRAEYQRALQEPGGLLDRGQSHDFVESFSYLFPVYEGGELYVPDVRDFAERAGKIEDAYIPLHNVPQLRFVMPWLREVLRFLGEMKAGRWQTFLDGEDRCRRVAADLTDYVEHIFRYAPALRPEGGGAAPERMLRALYRDARRWLVDFPRLRKELRPDES